MTTVRMPRTERRAQLLATARRVFGQTGYHQTAMTDIASAAGVTKPVLYQHFESKTDLYGAVLADVASRLSDTVMEAVAATTETEDRVRAGFAAFAQFVVADPDGTTLLMASSVSNDDPELARIGADTEGTLIETIASLYRNGGPLDDHIDFIVAGALGIGEVMARHWLSARRDVSAERLGELMATQALAGVSAYSSE